MLVTNVRERSWLKYSSRNSSEGEALRRFCDGAGLRQIVRGPTRVNISWIYSLPIWGKPSVEFSPRSPITAPLPVPRDEILTRIVWQFRDADWDGLKEALSIQDWSWLEDVDAHQGAQRLTDVILRHARRFIPQRCMKEQKRTHPWVNDRVMELVRLKRGAEGSLHEAVCRQQCSSGILEEYWKYAA